MRFFSPHARDGRPRVCGPRQRRDYRPQQKPPVVLQLRHLPENAAAHTLCGGSALPQLPIDGSGRVLIIQQKLDFIREHGITLVVKGSDWEGEYSFIEPYCEVRYLPRTEGVSTSGMALLLSTGGSKT